MSKENFPLVNHVRRQREERGWSQQELAARAGLSRTGVGAIEAGRLVPSTAAALALAAAFGCRVEGLFALDGRTPPAWAWPPATETCRYWRAEVGGRQHLYPVEASPLGTIPHDGLWRDGACQDSASADPARTLVVACCDPAVGLLAAEYARQTPFRMLVLPRASRAALELLAGGLVHAAGLHLGAGENGNRAAAMAALGSDFRLLRLTDWEAGVILDPSLGCASISGALTADLRWIGREAGSGARQVLDELSAGRLAPPHLARDHRGVAQAIKSGYAQAGIALRLVSEEEGLHFLGVRQEAFDLCLQASNQDEPRLRALVEVIRSAAYRRLLGELPGYDNRATGEYGA